MKERGNWSFAGPVCSILFQDYLLRTAKEGDWVFHSSCVTMEDPFELATQCVWSKILDHVEGYVAYKAVPVCRSCLLVLWFFKSVSIGKD